jgi:Lipopolysaccharide kinase (Kdo/WaaP) family
MLFRTILQVPDEIRAHVQGDVFDAMMALSGKTFRDVPGRKTMRIALGEKNYFIKQHFGVGWGEIFKNLTVLKSPILGAMTEVQAIQRLDEIGIKTTPLVAYGQRGCNPATLQSFVLTEDLGDIVSLEEMCEDANTYPMTENSKQLMLAAVAKIAAKLHAAGLAHRDFYLCHFVLNRQHGLAEHYDLHLIDLHRMLQHQPQNGDAIMKDMAGLVFSMLQNGFTAEDLTVLKSHYLPQSEAFWAKVETRANALLAKFNSTKFQQKLSQEKSRLG